mmetsp:Transcript_71164/g.212239  ORF Transcript_71164/g.212239 Transcript_71164/m.212239 type:complete len:202 (-) Transcript_71164:259-864(-)
MRGCPEDLHLDLVTDLVDLRVDRKHHGPQHAVAREPEVEEIKEEHDFNNSTDPGLDVRVVRHLDLLVDPIQRVEDAVATQRDDVQAGTPITAKTLSVAEDVLWYHRKTFNELGEGPQHLKHGVLVGEQEGGGGAREDDHGQVAGIMPSLIGHIHLPEEEQHDDGGADVRQLEENEVCSLRVVKEVQVPSDEHQEIEQLRAP